LIDAIGSKPNLDRTVLRSCLEAFERSTDGFPERFRLYYLSAFDVLLIIEEKTTIAEHGTDLPPRKKRAESSDTIQTVQVACSINGLF